MYVSALALAVLLLAAPSTADEPFRYRFEKGLVYDDTTVRTFHFEFTRPGDKKDQKTGKEAKPQLWDISTKEILRRTVLKVDKTAHPMIERVEVIQFDRIVKESPDPNERKGISQDPSVGRVFIWRRMKNAWKLFDPKDQDVTDRFPKLVNRLKNWRDARLPKKAVAVGQKWEVTMEAFLRTSGQPPPKDVEGIAAFNLDSLEKGLAQISFTASGSDRAAGAVRNYRLKGRWKFDTFRGRDLELESEGTVEIAGEKGFKGTMTVHRTVSYR